MAPERQRLLLLLPARRGWDWHGRLAEALARRHDVVTVRVASPSYPWSLRRTLGAAAAPPEPPPERKFDLILDLSETGAARAGRVLRPLYDGSPDTLSLIGRLQRGECPLLDIGASDGAILASSYAAIGGTGRLEDRLALCFARTQALLLRAVAGEGAPLADRPRRSPAPFSAARLLKTVARRFAAGVLAPVRRGGSAWRHWNIALRRNGLAPDIRHFDLAAYEPLPVDPAIFYADPFVVERDGRSFLFAEAFPYARGKGEIVCAEVGESIAETRFRTILERPWHLSYPFVFEWRGETWLAPEGSTHGGVELYRAAAFPWEWTFERRLLPDWPLVDATFFEHEGRLWLLAGAATAGGSDWDELYAWHAPSLEGPWEPHRLNPIKSDCRSARPGGRPLRLGGRLLRPAQRCEREYGEALAWLEIRTLTPDAFEEIELASWRAAAPGLSGPHGADLGDALAAVDFRMLLGR
ncbi:MAG TPA: hypothetical protein VMG08_04435 [Allosphingosinicella sp.]|nr:hypothetical protein [Allosphingosinicella sp.]